MKPIDHRKVGWECVRAHLSGLRHDVYMAFSNYGPATTRQVAAKSGISILTLRPRTTELLQLGFIEIFGGTEDSKEAVYIAVPVDLAKSRFDWLKAQPVQQELKLS